MALIGYVCSPEFAPLKYNQFSPNLLASTQKMEAVYCYRMLVTAIKLHSVHSEDHFMNRHSCKNLVPYTKY